MPRFSELIAWQREFERPRGLLEHNDPRKSVDRLREEIDEAEAEILAGQWLNALCELADVSIFIASIAMHIIDDLGLDDDFFDRYIYNKTLHNEEKYHEDYFGIGGLPDTEANMKRAKHTWNNGEIEGNDYY